MKRSMRYSALAAAVGALFSSSVRGAAFTWTGGEPVYGFLDLGGNWAGGTVGNSAGAPVYNANADLIFGAINPKGFAPTDRSGYTVDSITFNGGAFPYIMASSPSNTTVMTINGGVNNSNISIADNATNTETFQNPIKLGANENWSVAAGGTLAMTNTISGAYSLDKTGTGLLTLSGSNSYTGSTNISNGTLAFTGGTSTGTTSVFVADQVNTPAAFSLTGGTVNTTYFYTGYRGTGTANITGGNLNSSSYITAGDQLNVTGVFNLSGGTVTTPEMVAGSYGNGSVVQTGGTMNANTVLYVSLYGSTGNSGSYSLSGTNSVINTAQLNVGVRGTGTFTQTGGSVNASSSYLGYYAGVSGTYNLSAVTAVVNTPTLYVGYSGIGTLTQTGGSLTATNAISIADQSGGRGTYNLLGGSVTTPTLIVGNNGTGVVTQSGGTLTGNVVLGSTTSGVGTYNLSGGTLSTSSVTVGSGKGTFYFNGGTLQPTAAFGSTMPFTNAYVQAGGGTVSCSPAVHDTEFEIDQSFLHDPTAGAPAVDGGMTFTGNYNDNSVLLGGTSTYTGGTTLSGGIALTLLSSGALPTTGKITFANGTLTYGLGYNAITDYSSQFATLGPNNIQIELNAYNVTWAGPFSVTGGLFDQDYYNSGTLTVAGTEQYGSGATVENNSGTLTVAPTGTINVPNGTIVSVSKFNVNGNANGSGGQVNVGNITAYSGALFSQAGGTVTTASLGVYDTSKYNLNGGTLNVGTINASNANFNWSGGTLTLTDPNTPTVIGTGALLGASFTLTAARTLNVYSTEVVNGTFNQSGGINTIGLFNLSGASNIPGSLTVESAISGQGVYTLNSGALAVIANGVEIVGGSHSGTLNQSGGTNTATTLEIGAYAGGSGIYNLTGGTANLTNVYVGGTPNGPGGNGRLAFNTVHSLLTVAGGMTFYAGGSLSLSGAAAISTNALTIYGTDNQIAGGSTCTVGVGGLTLAGPNSPVFQISAPAYAPGFLVLNGPLTFNGASGTGVINSLGGVTQNKLDLGGGIRNFNISRGTASADVALSVSIQDGSFIKTGAGLLLLQSGNTFSQAVEVSAGTVQLGNTLALGSTGVNIDTGGTLDLGGFNVAAGTMSVTGSGVGGNGAVINSSLTASTWFGPVTLAGNTTIGSGPITLAGNVSGSGLTKAGYNTLTLSGIANFSGGLTVTGGSVSLTGNNTFTGGVNLGGGGLTVGSDTALGSTSNGVTLAQGGTLNISSNFSSGRTFTAAGGTLAVSTGQSLSVTGNVTGGGTLNVAGPGTTNLKGANALSGKIVVSGGLMDVSGTLPSVSTVDILATGMLQLDSNSVNSNDRLNDSGAVILDGGTFSLIGNPSVQTTESVGSLNLSSGASTISVNSTGPGAQLYFASMRNRSIGATVDFESTAIGATGKIYIAGLATGALGGFATVNGIDFAKYDPSAGILPFNSTDYAVNVFTTGSNVRLDPSVTLPAVPMSVGSGSISTLNIAAGNFNVPNGTETNTVWVNQSSGSLLTFTSGGLIKSGTNDANISGGSLTSTSGELDVSVAGGNLNISSSLVGNFVLTERGAGTLILSGSPSNTYTGFTLVSGTLDLASNTGRTIPGDLIINGGYVLSQADNQLNTTSNVIINSGTWNLNGRTETIASLTNNAGTMLFNHGTLNVTNGVNFNGGTTTIASVLNMSSGTILSISGGVNTIGSQGSINLSSTAGGTSGKLTFAGDSPAVTLSPSNTFPGKFNLSDGVAINDPATGTASILTSGSGTLPAAVDLMGSTNHTITINPSSILAINVKVTDGGFNVSGGGTLQLGGANDFTGGLNIGTATTVMAMNTQALGTASSPITFSGGTLALRSGSASASFGYSTTVAAPNLSSAINVDLVTVVPGATAGTFSLNSITTGSGGAALTVSGNDGGSLTTNALAMQYMQYNGSATTYIHANISIGVIGPVFNTGGGSVNIIKDGTGTLTLGGSISNSFGTLTTTAGTVLLSKSNGATAVANAAIAVANGLSISGSTVQLAASNQIDPGTIVAINGANGQALLDLNGNNNNFSGGITFTAGGTLSTGTGIATLLSDVTTTGAAGTAYIYGNLNIGSGGTRTFNITKGTSAYDMQIAATITGNENLTKAGAGTLYLTGTNTFTGAVTVAGGILEADSAANLGNNPVTLAGGTLQFTQAFSYASTAALAFGAGTTSSIDSGSNVVTIASNITGTGVLSKVGSGTLILSGTNTATGGTVINTGTIQVASDISLGAATAPITLAGGTLTAATPANLSTGTLNLTQPLAVSSVGGTLNAVNTVITLSSPINWGGNLNFSSGTITANINSGTETVTGSPTLTILPTANFNDGGTVDPLASGANVVNLTDSSGTNFNVLSGIKQVGMISGAGSTNVASGAILTATCIRQSILTIGGSAMIPISAAHNASAGVSVVSTLVLTNSSNGLIGRLDLGNNDLVIHTANLTTITNQIATAYQNYGSGPGIASSAATNNPTHLTMLGVMQNNQSGTALYTATNPFDGITPNSADILIKYTYYGDTNLDGKIDGTDYSRIDNGYLQKGTLTGWFNGDFNYDGVINGSDYTLIDNAFNQQGAQLSATLASPSANVSAQIAAPSGPSSVPEPTSLALLTIATTGLLGRRTRVAEYKNHPSKAVMR